GTEFSELGARVADVKKYLKKVGYTDENIEEAIARGRDLSIDHRRMGAWIRKLGINRVNNFFNSQIQGVDKFARTFKKHPFRTLLRGFVTITLPGLFLTWLCRDNDHYNEELPWWRKDFFWNVPVGDPNTTKVFVPIPLPYEWALVFNAIPQRAIKQARGSKKAWDEFWESFEQSVVPEFMPSALQPLFQDATGRDWRGVPILNEADKRLSPEHPELQYNDYTSELSKFISNTLKDVPVPEAIRSPKRLDKLLKGYTGTLGSITLDSIDQFTGNKEGIPIVGGLLRNFVIDAQHSPQSVQDFYNYKEKLNSKVAAATRKGVEPDEKTKSYNTYFNQVGSAISQYYDVKAIIERSDVPDKQAKIDALNEEIIILARAMTKLYEEEYR
ncbi:MAG: hypothetical protein GX660_21795, partial [Clostridiaceae bacterium]|nr:hypothetical protein [Clostridiaceae bacterium]